MAARASGRSVAALLLLLVPSGVRAGQGLGDESALVQLQEGSGSMAAHAEATAEMVNGMVSLFKGAFGGRDHHQHKGSGRGHGGGAKQSIMDGPAGCVWARDRKSAWQHMSELLPTIEHGVLTAMLPKMIEQSKLFSNPEASAPSEEDMEAQKKAMKKQMKEVMAPLQDELMPPECDQKLMKKKIMSQSLAGGGDGEEIMAKCLVKATHITPACARCAGNFLGDFMGRGMVGLASSCAVKCMPGQNACKKGITDQCITKSFTCVKCMKPGMLQFADCVGLNTTHLGLSNKLDLLAKALRDGSTSEEGLPGFINDIVLALNA